jgi:hypothetical protein
VSIQMKAIVIAAVVAPAASHFLISEIRSRTDFMAPVLTPEKIRYQSESVGESTHRCSRLDNPIRPTLAVRRNSYESYQPGNDRTGPNLRAHSRTSRDKTRKMLAVVAEQIVVRVSYFPAQK